MFNSIKGVTNQSCRKIANILLDVRNVEKRKTRKKSFENHASKINYEKIFKVNYLLFLYDTFLSNTMSFKKLQ